MRTSPRLVLTLATLKMWLRDRQALFWTILLPIFIMVVFGILNFGAFGNVTLGIVDQAGNGASRTFVEGLRSIKSLKLTVVEDMEGERRALEEGKRDLVVVLSPEFGVPERNSTVRVLYNQGGGPEVQVGQAILRQALDEMTFAFSGTPRLFTMDLQPVTGRNLRYIDFLLPGIVAMSVMQMGMFSIVFAVVQLKQRGIIRRLRATPVRAGDFLFAQVATRLVVALLQTLVLVGVGVLFFHAQFVGNLGLMLALAAVGAAVFLTMGFAIAGVVRTEEAAAPIANLVVLPQMFLSGVFFSRDVVPGALRQVTEFLPLTYLADSLRAVAVQGSTLGDIWLELAGLAVWMLLGSVLAARLFRWE